MLAFIWLGIVLGTTAGALRLYPSIKPELERRQAAFLAFFEQFKYAQGLRGTYSVTFTLWPLPHALLNGTHREWGAYTPADREDQAKWYALGHPYDFELRAEAAASAMYWTDRRFAVLVLGLVILTGLSALVGSLP